MPKVSVLLTSYNYEAFLRESVETVLSQTFKDLELIVVDDCSEDSSLQILNSFDDGRLTVIRNEKNMGQEYAFSLINELAKGEYIAIADADCRWLPDKLEKQVDFLNNHPDFAAVFTKANFIDANGDPNTGEEAKIFDLFDVKNRKRQEWLCRFFYAGNCFCNPSVLIRRDAYKSYYSTAHGMWTLQDMYKWTRLLLKNEVFVIDDNLVDVRLHGNNMSGPLSIKNFMRMSNELYQIYELFFRISKEDFKIAFPEQAEKYTVNGKINTKFALSRMMLALECPSVKTLALNTLFCMLNNPEEKTEIAGLYGYDDTSYRDDETENIPYVYNSLMRTAKQYSSKMYFDFGNGYDEANSIAAEFFPDLNGCFTLRFSDIKSLFGDKKMTSLRFDPATNFVRMKLDSVICDGEALEFRPNTEGLFEQYSNTDGTDVFYTDDPSYTITPPDRSVSEIEICGTIGSVSQKEASDKLRDVITDRQTREYELTKSLEETRVALTNELERTRIALTEELNKTQLDLDITSNELQLVLNSFSWKITKPVRGAKKIIKKLLHR
ncbi:MAG: glycosyltransferase [Clostridia bacterium]|nr:glycosyltransferase [Clostridia bacterium]